MKVPNHIEIFWRSFLYSESSPKNANDLFQISYQIGADENDADEGSKLIVNGDKTATSALLWEFEDNGEPLPEIGYLCVIEDGKNKPVCVVKTTWVKTIPFGEVDASFAHDYSETSGTLEDWYKVFGEYYSIQCESMGRKLTNNTPLVCERFQVIFP